MKLAILSDVHGNIHALGRALEIMADIPCDYLVVLGDLVGYGAFPNQCVDLFRSLSLGSELDVNSLYFLETDSVNNIKEKLSGVKCQIVVGNHDWAMINEDYRYMNPVAAAALQWTCERITSENKKFLANLSMVKLQNDAYFVHGSPDEPEHFIYITNRHQVMQAFTLQQKFICFHGHTHIPAIFKLNHSDMDYLVDCQELALDSQERYLINVGSVGQPRDRDPRGAIAFYDSEKKYYRLLRFDYDIESAAQSIIDAGLPKLCADRLGWGL